MLYPYLQTDWDLAILWVSRHVDGISNAQQISIRAEVDLEMVRACLRVLKHHGVVALVDMFFYSNRYECTSVVPTAALLQEAASMVYKQPPTSTTNNNGKTTGTNKGDMSPEFQACSPFGSFSSQIRRPVGRSSSDGTARDGSPHGPPRIQLYHQQQQHPTHYNNNETMIMSSSLPSQQPMKPDQRQMVQDAMAEFFASCRRDLTVGELWLQLLQNGKNQQQVQWKRMFRRIDHRRLITFGLVHGWIRRIHCYPRLVGAPTGLQKKKNNLLVERAAALLDGTHCDDAIVSTLDISLRDVYNLFPGQRIVEVLA